MHGANWLCLRIRGPNFQNNKGQGTNRSATRPISVQAKFTPNCMGAFYYLQKKRLKDAAYPSEHLNCEKRERGSESRPNKGIRSESRSTIHQIRVHKVTLQEEMLSSEVSRLQKTHQEGHENEADAHSNYDRAESWDIPRNSGILTRPT